MNGVRIAISLFLIALLTLVVFGWIWTGAHQPPAQAAASHVVLGISAVAGVVALFFIWRRDPPGQRSIRS
jgi:hypothetical protein